MTDALDPTLLTTLGVAEASQALDISGAETAIWNGETVDATTVLVKYTYAGDANLDGRIDADDFFWIDRGFAIQEKGYANGDFDYNGRIDADDYFLIDRNYQRVQAMQSAPAAVAAPVKAMTSPAYEPSFSSVKIGIDSAEDDGEEVRVIDDNYTGRKTS